MTDIDTRVPPASGRLDGLPGYGRGRAGQGQVFRHRLGSNEAPEGPTPAVVEAAMAALSGGNRYPDLRGEALAEALAHRHGVGADMVAVAAGSIVLLDQIVRAWCDPGDEIVVPWRSYEAYPIIAGLAGARLVEVPLDNEHRADPATICSAVGPGCRVVILCNPNNPTGTALDADELDALIAALPAHVLVVLDEAYADYADDAGTVAASPAQRLARHGNLAILRTFSKAWGLAGLRAGYCLADPRIVNALHAVAPPFPLPAPVVAAALAALEAPEAVEARAQNNASQRVRMAAGLRALGFPVAESRANFLWLAVRGQAVALTAHFRDAGIAVRCFADEGVRITTGNDADTAAVLAAAAAWREIQERT